jgi:hypothetical protein
MQPQFSIFDTKLFREQLKKRDSVNQEEENGCCSNKDEENIMVASSHEKESPSSGLK